MIVTGYALSFAALMPIGGKLADSYGRRRLFVPPTVAAATRAVPAEKSGVGRRC